MMDLVTDYKAITKENTASTKEHLRKIYANISEFDDDNISKFIFEVNKYYTALSSWFNVLYNGDENLDKLLNNILFDYCSLVHCIILKDIKLINFLYRNVIESFLRHCTKDITSRQVDVLFSNTNNLIQIGNKKDLLMNYTSQLKQIYDENCLYIHTDVSKIKIDFKTLLDYQASLGKNEEFEILDKVFIKINTAILCILKILYESEFGIIKVNARGYIIEAMKLDERVKIKEAKNSMK